MAASKFGKFFWLSCSSSYVITDAWVQNNVGIRRVQPIIGSSEVNEINDDSEAISAFGTREYWDDLYSGRGDFPADEYT